jgi:hypothetical protein
VAIVPHPKKFLTRKTNTDHQTEIGADAAFHALTQDGTISARVADEPSQTAPKLVG